MHPLVKTVALRGSGSIKFREDFLRIQTLAPHFAGISAGISGRLERHKKGHHMILTDSVMLISITCAIVIFRLKISDLPDQLQVVMFQMNPCQQKLTWNHLATFDSRGALETLKSSDDISDYFFLCSPFAVEHPNFTSTQIALQFRWVRSPSKSAVTNAGGRSCYICEKKIQISCIQPVCWDGETFAMFEGFLVE